MEAAIGVIGGSGLYAMPGLTEVREVRVTTPFGDPSDAFITGRLHGRRMVFLPRHGVGHRILPHEINFRANLWGFKHLGVERLISVSAVGSMKESIAPGHLVLADQFIDRTRRRVQTFYGDGIVVHVPFAEPICPAVRSALYAARTAVDTPVHAQGTYICIDGPQFSTKAESLLYRSWGVDVIGMTNMPEAKLAREAEICYATIALATDYDCWHESEESVTVEAVLRTLKANVERAQRLIDGFVQNAPAERSCGLCATAARTSLMSDPAKIPEATKQRLQPILRHFMPV
ncbi:MAG: S-methyl-5'-thioadenosine phosphorylase [Deltaproteobacteria bacterium]|nr:S-methyl-5'-thioadenosine phosphorylase [Deltaproteobacteria bacterium]